MTYIIVTLPADKFGERERKLVLDLPPADKLVSGRQDYLLTAPQAATILNAWSQVSPTNVFSHPGPESEPLSWFLDRPEWVRSSCWPTITSPAAGTPAHWSSRAFPGAIHCRRQLPDSEAIERITRFMNQPGPVNGGDLVEAVSEVIIDTGRTIKTN